MQNVKTVKTLNKCLISLKNVCIHSISIKKTHKIWCEKCACESNAHVVNFINFVLAHAITFPI